MVNLLYFRIFCCCLIYEGKKSYLSKVVIPCSQCLLRLNLRMCRMAAAIVGFRATRCLTMEVPDGWKLLGHRVWGPILQKLISASHNIRSSPSDHDEGLDKFIERHGNSFLFCCTICSTQSIPINPGIHEATYRIDCNAAFARVSASLFFSRRMWYHVTWTPNWTSCSTFSTMFLTSTELIDG